MEAIWKEIEALKEESRAQRKLIEELLQKQKRRSPKEQPFFTPPKPDEVYPYAVLSTEEDLCFVTFTKDGNHLKYRVEDRDVINMEELYAFLKANNCAFGKKIYMTRMYATFNVFVKYMETTMVCELAVRGGKMHVVNQEQKTCWGITRTWRTRFTWKKLADMYKYKNRLTAASEEHA